MQGDKSQTRRSAARLWAAWCRVSRWREHGGTKNLDIAANAGLAFGLGLFVYAAIVLVLKINAIIQLVFLAIAIAQAIAMAAATFGASLLQIPIVRQIVKEIIQYLIETAIWQIIG